MIVVVFLSLGNNKYKMCKSVAEHKDSIMGKGISPHNKDKVFHFFFKNNLTQNKGKAYVTNNITNNQSI